MKKNLSNVLYYFFMLMSIYILSILCVQKAYCGDFNKPNFISITTWSDIPQSAKTDDGFARIIVEFDVPDIERLTQSSTELVLPHADQVETFVIKQAMETADAALASAVYAAGITVLERLTENTYNINHRYWFIPMMALDVSPKALSRLQSDFQVKAIYPDIPIPLPEYELLEDDNLNEKANDTSSQSISYPQMSDTISLIGADRAWSKGYSGSGWFVAVLDSGIRRSHEFFRNKTILEACFSARRHCPNGQTTMTGTGAATHYSSTYAGYDHGTHVAGTAAGRKPDGTLFGVARDADIIAVNVFSRFTSSECERPDGRACVMTFTSDSLAGLQHVYGLRISRNIGAVNMSLGGGRFTSYCDSDSRKPAIDNLRAARIPTAISSGNNGYCGAVGSPGCISTAITVMASTKADKQANFSNWHSTIGSIFAPGVSIRSATGSSDTSYARWDGTSMAAPHVAGGLTLMRQFQSTATVPELLRRITEKGPLVSTLCSSGGSKRRINLDSFAAVPGAPSLISPANGSNKTSSPTTGMIYFNWSQSSGNPHIFHIQVSINANFSTLSYDNDKRLVSSVSLINFPDDGTMFYWRVRGRNLSGWGPWSEVWSFTNGTASTRIIRLTGDLSFDNVTVGQTATRTLTIHNDGNSTLNITGISYPSDFSGSWKGNISAGGFRNITVTFWPTEARNYSGTITVDSNKTGGTNTISCSGIGQETAPKVPLPGVLMLLLDEEEEPAPEPQPGDIWTDQITGMEFVWVPGGCFDRGCGGWDGECRDNELPVREVCLDGFWMGKYEVTQGQWTGVMGSNPSHFQSGDNYPVETVSWNDVQGFITELNTQGSSTFRLPTEAEWEYAARSGGREEKYAGGDDLDSLGWYSGNGGSRTHVVGTKAPNGLGLYDISGNVWEWVSDWMDVNYYSVSPRDNPQGPETGIYRVFRGGGWRSSATHSRAAIRYYFWPNYKGNYVGFRLALSPGQQ